MNLQLAQLHTHYPTRVEKLIDKFRKSRRDVLPWIPDVREKLGATHKINLKISSNDEHTFPDP